MQIVVLDYQPEHFYPISQTRPVWDIFHGMYAPYERMLKLCEDEFPGVEVYFHIRKGSATFFTEEYSHLGLVEDIGEKDTLFLNPFLYDLSFLRETKSKLLLSSNKEFAAFKASASEAALCMRDGQFSYPLDIEPQVCNSIDLPAYIWDLVTENGESIKRDFATLDSLDENTFSRDITLVGDPSRLFIDKSATIDPHVVFDTRLGPIYVSADVHLQPFTRIEGPAYLGAGSILLGAKMRLGCSLGRSCRVGGEIEDSIFHSYSNKYHDGFIGHAYLGSWVNLGALATNSDLKNDYSTVSVRMPEGVIDTGETKVGTFIGDHSKLSIGTLINTGTTIGCASMLVHSGRMTPPHIPSFSLFIKNELRDIKSFELLVEAIRKVMARRNKECSDSFIAYMKTLYTEQSNYRENEQKQWNANLK